MSPADARIAKLAADLLRYWNAVRAHRERASLVEPESGAPERALIALSLDHAYQAFESLLKRLEQGLGLQQRGGAHWHEEILADAGEEIVGLRPKLVSEDAATDWRELLRFRHFLRHAYTIELDGTKLRSTRQHLDAAVADTQPNVEALLTALRGF